MKAIWNNIVIAESADTVVVEGNHYFPPDSIAHELFKPSATTTVCPWKGTASYYTLDVDGKQVGVYRSEDSRLVLDPDPGK